MTRMIHAFHIGLKGGAPHRSAANNLIEGSHAQVVAMLDRLTYDEDGDPTRREAKDVWRAATEDMWERRTGSRVPKPSVKGD